MRLTRIVALAVLGAAIFLPVAGQAGTICTVIADADRNVVVLEEGDCDRRVTPASTFKLALAIMGFDAGILVDEHTPVFPYRDGYPDWAGAAWKQDTDPQRWLKYSVLWYSRLITHAMGQETVQSYLTGFNYGNADFSGDPGKNNSLDRAWLTSSLEISPAEQVAFLTAFVNRTLPVKPAAYDAVEKAVEPARPAAGWIVSGKTGTAFPRRPDGSFDRASGYGWFVGWARHGARAFVFARLTQDERRQSGPAGTRTRASFLDDMPSLGKDLLQ